APAVRKRRYLVRLSQVSARVPSCFGNGSSAPAGPKQFRKATTASPAMSRISTYIDALKTILYRIKLYRGANDHAKTERTQAQARSSPGCKACCKCASDS